MSDAYAVTVAILFVAAGFALAVVAKRVFGVGDAGLSISLLIVPFAIFLIASGRIERFEGWGIKATFQRLAGTELQAGSLCARIIPVEQPSLDEIRKIEKALEFVGGSAPVVFLRSDVRLSQEGIRARANVIKNSLLSGTLKFVVVVDGTGEVLGYFHPGSFLDLVHLPFEFAERPGAGHYDPAAVDRALLQTRFSDIVENPAMRARDWGDRLLLSPVDTCEAAFRKLRDAKSPGAIVADHNFRYRGFLTMERITEALMSGLLDAGPGQASGAQGAAKP